jgi:hypothetical protein
MTGKVTNERLRQLLLDLGFAKGQLVANNHRAYRHPDSHCLIVLPDNRDADTARTADVAGIRDHLAHQGHARRVSVRLQERIEKDNVASGFAEGQRKPADQDWSTPPRRSHAGVVPTLAKTPRRDPRRVPRKCTFEHPSRAG